MCTLTCFFLPFHGAFPDGLCTRVDRQRSPHPGSALWVSSASGVRCFEGKEVSVESDVQSVV